MEISVQFPGGKRVDALVEGQVIHSDQSLAHGGEGSAPEPYTLFLASLATCAGVYVLGFCKARNIPTDGITLVQHAVFDPETRRLQSIAIDLGLPPEFPDRYRDAVRRAAESCKVKKTLFDPPTVEVRTLVGGV